MEQDQTGQQLSVLRTATSGSDRDNDRAAVLNAESCMLFRRLLHLSHLQIVIHMA